MMKTSIKNIFVLIAFSYVIEANINCAAGVAAAAFIPLIGATNWVNAANPDKNHFNFITIDSPNSNTSTFDGNEHFINSNNVDSTFHFTGSFLNHDIQFKYDADAGSRAGKSYKGLVNDASSQITLTSTDGLPAITLKKQ